MGTLQEVNIDKTLQLIKLSYYLFVHCDVFHPSNDVINDTFASPNLQELINLIFFAAINLDVSRTKRRRQLIFCQNREEINFSAKKT